MAIGALQKQYQSRSNDFYRNHYHHIFIALMMTMVFFILLIVFVLYQLYNRPLPVFIAVKPSGEKMQLEAFNEPNLLPDTLLKWASKAATAAYTFDFVNYNKQIAAVRPYFTNDGWQDYLNSVDSLIKTIVQNQLIINGVVSEPPVISNQGPLPGKGYVWRIQIPFLVTYQTANTTSKQDFMVMLTIVHVPTDVNPQGIGIDQFVMR